MRIDAFIGRLHYEQPTLFIQLCIARTLVMQTHLASLKGKYSQVRQRRRGKWEGLHARPKTWATKPPLPSLLLVNVCSLDNKLHGFKARLQTQCETRDCCALLFTETWLSCNIHDYVLQLVASFSEEANSTTCEDENDVGSSKEVLSTFTGPFQAPILFCGWTCYHHQCLYSMGDLSRCCFITKSSCSV